MEVRFSVKGARVVSAYSCCIGVSSGKVQQRHQPHTIKTHALVLHFPTVENDAVSNENNGR